MSPMLREFTEVQFENRTRAEAILSRIENQFAANLLVPLASLLRESPDPDGALNWLGRYAETAPPDVLAALGEHLTALTFIVAVFGTSGFLAATLVAEPGLAVQFARDRNFARLKSKEDLLQDFAR